jgi:hypothetical protein
VILKGIDRGNPEGYFSIKIFVLVLEHFLTENLGYHDGATNCKMSDKYHTVPP